MHQDEHNQPEQPVTLPTPVDGEQPEAAPPPPAPVTLSDPALASAAFGAGEPPQPSEAETPIDAIAAPPAADPSVSEAPTASRGSLYTEPAWMTSESTNPESPASSETQVSLPEPPPAAEAPVYASPSWTASEEQANSWEQSPTPDTYALSDEPDRGDSPAPPAWQPSEGYEAYAADAVPAPPPTWMAPPISDSPSQGEGAEAEASYPGPAEPHVHMPQGGPNWMLAFVCGWAAFTSFMEAPVAYAAKETMINGSTVTLTASDRMYGGLGFALLGLGLLLFGIEALLWGRRRRGVSALLTIGLPVVVSLAGIVCLILSHYPGSRI